MNKITTAIIPVAGKGIRMNPVTKVIPKTMLPINNIPCIQYLLEEAYSEGITNFIIVLNSNQKIIIDYLDITNIDNTHNGYKELIKLISNINITYIYQDESLGLADAIYKAKDYISKDEYFSILLGDDLFFSSFNIYGIGSLIKQYAKNNACYVGIKKVKRKETEKYGIVKIDKDSRILNIVEKPKDNPPSNKACVGRYILNYKIFDYIEKLKNKQDNVLFTDALKMYINEYNIYAKEIMGKRFDIGCLKDYVIANKELYKRKNKTLL